MSAEAFKTVGLVGRFQDPQVREPAEALRRHLQRRGIEVVVPRATAEAASLADCRVLAAAAMGAACDLVIAVGGDGTMLHAVHMVARHGVPLIGVNRGRLGFLTDISPEEMTDHLDDILAGRHVADTRLLLEAEIRGPGDRMRSHPGMALNEVVLQKHQTGHMLDIMTWINGIYLNTHGGDGLIVATATGSTAYALSCGGPILQPDMDPLVLVPICPHTLSDRPLVIPGSSVVECRMEQRLDTRAQVTCDGELLGEFGPQDVLRIRRGPQRVTLLHPANHDFYDILRSKLHWGRDSRRRGD